MSFNKFLRTPEIIPCDKRLHFIIGVVFSFFFAFFTSNIVAQLIALIIVGFGIEAYQYFTKSGQVEVLDAIAVILGGIFIILTEFLL